MARLNEFSKVKKETFFHLRINNDDRSLIEMGANIKNIPISEYIRYNMRNIAKKDIEEMTQKLSPIQLSEKDWDRFIKIMNEEQPEINENLKSAFEELDANEN